MVHRIECLDVGQGTCNLIQLPGNRFIIIDVGPPKGWQVLAKRLNLDPKSSGPKVVIEALILSHSHNDHIGALSALLESDRVRIERIFLTQDGPAEKGSRGLDCQRNAIEDENRNLSEDQLNRCEIGSAESYGNPECVYRSESPIDEPNGPVTLSLLYPTASEAEIARKKNDKNLGSAILCLRVGEHRFLFPGDASLVACEAVGQRMPRCLNLELIAVSHHGGKLWNGRYSQSICDRLEKLFREIFRPKYAVISVGTANTHKHPRERIIDALRSVDARVMCTQLTCKCWKGDLEQARPLTLSNDPPEFPGMSSKDEIKKDGRSFHVGCASTVVVKFEGQQPIVERWREHSQVVNRIREEGESLC